jgi:sugar phosphate isomerase/epimerase
MWSYFRKWKAGEMDIPGFIFAAKDAGADGVELLDFFYGGEGIDEKRAAAKDALAHTGLPCPIFSVAQNFAKPTSDERAAELKKIVFGIEEAQHFGAKVVRVFAGDVSPGITFDQAREWIVDGLVEASQYASEAGVKLALENHGTLAGKAVQVISLIEDVRQKAGNDSLGANPDTGNFLLIDPPSHVAVVGVRSYAYMVHFKDFRYAKDDSEGFVYGPENLRFVGTALGEGEVDLASCISALKQVGFKGWLSLEYEGEEDSMTAVPRSLAYARTLIGSD